MNRRRYRIEANIKTLQSFLVPLSECNRTDCFVQRLTPDANEEYYYVVVIAPPDIHETLKRRQFTDSVALVS